MGSHVLPRSGRIPYRFIYMHVVTLFPLLSQIVLTPAFLAVLDEEDTLPAVALPIPWKRSDSIAGLRNNLKVQTNPD